jgi:hypothetical protein
MQLQALRDLGDGVEILLHDTLIGNVRE